MYRIPIYQVKLVRDGSHAAERKKVSQPAVAAEVLWTFLEGADREHFVVLLLDTQNQIIGIHTVTVGTLDASLVHPREIYKAAILANAASVVLAHNHPSGDPTPSLFRGSDCDATDSLRRETDWNRGARPCDRWGGIGQISKQGDVYLRMLLIHGARSALYAAERRRKAGHELTRLQRWALERAGAAHRNCAAVAMANKMARIVWAVWKHERSFNGNFQPQAQAA
jgi:DNA repair protein RadC